MNKTKKNNFSYKSSGVNVELGRQFVDMIKPLASTTQTEVNSPEIGGFGAVFDIGAAGFKDPLLVAATDGVGTKLLIANEIDAHQAVGIDLVAMCVNDLVAQAAKPLFFLDYIASGNLDTTVGTHIIEGIVLGCKQANCALIGGETAEMPGLYAPKHYDLAGFAVGAVERNDLVTGRTVQAGGQIIGLGSSGFHSNGFSLIRQIIGSKGLKLSDLSPFSQQQTTIGEALIQPTRIYTQPILHALEEVKNGIRGIAHITGGGFFENIPRILPSELSAVINASRWTPAPIFGWLQEIGTLKAAEMFSTFNCGIGIVILVNPTELETICTILEDDGEKVFHIGEIKPRQENDEQVIIQELETQWN